MSAPDPAPPPRTPGEHEIIERLDRVGAEVVAARAELDALHRRTRVTQELVAKEYERGQDWPGKLEAVRQSPCYEAPYEAEPLITATIPTYNRAGLLCERALTSLRRQTYENWEAVVVGDHCTDDTEECVRAIGDPRIRFENLSFRGPYPADPEERWKMAGVFASNRCVELATGAWLAPLDDDDEWDDDHLELLLAHAQSTRAEIAYGQWRQRDSRNGRLIDRTFGVWPVTIEQFAFQCSLIHNGLRAVPFDPNARLAGEPGDWNRARRLCLRARRRQAHALQRERIREIWDRTCHRGLTGSVRGRAARRSTTSLCSAALRRSRSRGMWDARTSATARGCPS